MKYNHLFFDLDHTLWDFDANSKQTLIEIYNALELAGKGIHDFTLFHQNYLVHNERLWDRYRKGYIKSDELRWKRMWLALLDFKIADEPLAREMSTRFLDLLPTRTLLFPDTIELLEYLTQKNYQLHLITNGFESVQQQKIHNSGIHHYFSRVITSEASNSLKPQKEIFDFALQKAGALAAESIMIGDTMEADILGAYGAGIDQVHVNHLSKEKLPIHADTFPTYTVFSLKELKLIF